MECPGQAARPSRPVRCYQLHRAVEQWARRHPLPPGMLRETAVCELGLPDPALLGPLLGAAGLVHDATGLHHPDVRPALPDGAARPAIAVRRLVVAGGTPNRPATASSPSGVR